MYVRTYVLEYVMLRNVDRNVVGFCRPIEFYLLQRLDGARTTILRNRSVDECVVLQGYIWSQTVDICLYRNSTIISLSQRLGYKRAGPSGLAELEQLHVESNSECIRHINFISAPHSQIHT